jgi:DNA-binding CsgD family transcriptional regulator
VGLGALLIKRAISQISGPRSSIVLSPSEHDVLRMICLGKSTKEIADARSRSSETVKRQLASLYRKLGVNNRTSAIAAAREHQLL